MQGECGKIRSAMRVHTRGARCTLKNSAMSLAADDVVQVNCILYGVSNRIFGIYWHATSRNARLNNTSAPKCCAKTKVHNCQRVRISMNYILSVITQMSWRWIAVQLDASQLHSLRKRNSSRFRMWFAFIVIFGCLIVGNVAVGRLRMTFASVLIFHIQYQHRWFI